MNIRSELLYRLILGWTLLSASTLIIASTFIEMYYGSSSFPWVTFLLCSIGLYAGVYNIALGRQLRRQARKCPQ